MRSFYVLETLVAGTLLLAGCGARVQTAEELLPAGFALPEKQIYSLGEATHGSAEFTLARQDVFEYLVKERGVRAFCLEADFGEGQKINRLLYGKSWNAASTMRQFAFWVYQHREMANLLQWIRDYNSTAAPEGQVRFYGMDCQQWDDGRAWLQTYLKDAAPELAALFLQPPLSGISDRKMQEVDAKTVAACIESMGTLIAGMQGAHAELAAAQGEREYDIALRVAENMRLSLRLQEAGPDLGNMFREDLSKEEAEQILAQSSAVSGLRDAGMADTVAWILQHETTYYGRDAIFITGHNGHIAKENNQEDVDQLGELLAQRYGGEYYAIGTDFGSGWFKAVELGGRGLKAFRLEEGPLAAYFSRTGAPVVFVEFSGLQGAEEAFFESPQWMHSIGAVFHEGWKRRPGTYLQENIPADCYDALLYFQEVHAFHSN